MTHPRHTRRDANHVAVGREEAMRSLVSTWRGIVAMRRPFTEPAPRWSAAWCRGFWCDCWTPVWHEGRGPYVSLGLGFVAVYRGY
jgi:hypothetical protein